MKSPIYSFFGRDVYSHKPRILKLCSLWICIGMGWIGSLGDSPEHAYDRWHHEIHTYGPLKKKMSFTPYFIAALVVLSILTSALYLIFN